MAEKSVLFKTDEYVTLSNCCGHCEAGEVSEESEGEGLGSGRGSFTPGTPPAHSTHWEEREVTAEEIH